MATLNWNTSSSFFFDRYFKTLAAQEPGEQNVLYASYGKLVKDTGRTTDLLPFFGTDYGLCSLIKPQISFNRTLEHLPFEALMTNYSRTIAPGIQVRGCPTSDLVTLRLKAPTQKFC